MQIQKHQKEFKMRHGMSIADSTASDNKSLNDNYNNGRNNNNFKYRDQTSEYDEEDSSFRNPLRGQVSFADEAQD